MTFKRFILLSIAVHIVALVVIYLMPAPKPVKQREMVATLVTPETPAPPPSVRKKALPIPPAKRKPPATRMPRARTKPEPPLALKRTRPQLAPPPPPPLEEEPVPPAIPTVPGEGRGTGKSASKEPPRGTGGVGRSGTGLGALQEKSTGPKGPSDMAKLFDRGVTEEIARKGTGDSGTKGEKDSPITFDTKEYKFAGYLSQLRAKIESIWVYPPEAAQRGIYGDLKIRFTIKKDGTLGEVRLVRTSGYKMLDDAAINALKDGAPYWPLPDSWGKKEYTILGHFVYSMYGYRIQ